MITNEINEYENRFLFSDVDSERVRGIGPPYLAWEANVLPLNYARKSMPTPLGPTLLKFRQTLKFHKYTFDIFLLQLYQAIQAKILDNIGSHHSAKSNCFFKG